MSSRHLISALVLCTLGTSSASADARLPHLDLELSGAEYQTLLREDPRLLEEEQTPSMSSRRLQSVLDAGKRNLEWLAHLNSRRPGSSPLSLSSPETQIGYPIESPRIFNETLVLDWFAQLRSEIPASIAAIVLDGAPFTPDAGMSDSEYIAAALKIDRIYQLAARWLLLAPWRPQLEARRKNDVRAYVALTTDPNLQGRLDGFASLPDTEKQLLLKHLFELCFNSRSESACRSDLSRAQSRGELSAFYARHLAGSQKVYSNFFTITSSRSDVRWTSTDPLTMRVPFLDPKDPTVLAFLRDHIEDEWKWNGWKLVLEFQPNWSWGLSRIVFEPGATPHVDGLAGNTITMDANTPLTEYNVQWTIRHEYGHVLGFPDCYHEFWDADLQAIVSYQLDITNLMCSRRGKLQEKHFDELKLVYFK
jgi:hypothetical protein